MSLWMLWALGCGVVDYTEKTPGDTDAVDSDGATAETDVADTPVIPDPPDTPNPDTSTGADTATDTASGGGGGGGGGGAGAFPIDAYVYSSIFGYDPVNDLAVPVVYQGQFLGPRFEFVAGSNAYFAGTAPSEACVLIFESGTPMTSSVLAAGSNGYFTLELTSSMGFGTTCTGLQPPSKIAGLQQFIVTPPAFYAGGVHPAPFFNATAQGVISRAGLDAIASPGWMTNPLNGFGYEQDLGYAIGYELDDLGNVVFDASGRLVPIPIANIPTGGPLPRGFYITSSLYFFPPTP